MGRSLQLSLFYSTVYLRHDLPEVKGRIWKVEESAVRSAAYVGRGERESRWHRWGSWREDEWIKSSGGRGSFGIFILFYSLTYTTYSNI